MAALNFPATPAIDDIHTENGVSWKWTGYVWRALVPTSGGGGGGAGLYLGTSPPGDPITNPFWFDTNYGTLRVYYDSTWIDSGGMANVVCSATAPANPIQGMVWFNTTTGVTSTYFDGYWVSDGAGVEPDNYTTFRNLTILNL